MTAILSVVIFIVLWWTFSVALFCGVLYVFDRDALEGFLDDLWRVIRS